MSFLAVRHLPCTPTSTGSRKQITIRHFRGFEYMWYFVQVTIGSSLLIIPITIFPLDPPYSYEQTYRRSAHNDIKVRTKRHSTRRIIGLCNRSSPFQLNHGAFSGSMIGAEIYGGLIDPPKSEVP